ncbi:MAG: DUF3160 domain-containing protein [Opitutaceae bacterium]|nr:DUF3160 domain-containing protein [Opitutaceae bacterium]
MPVRHPRLLFARRACAALLSLIALLSPAHADGISEPTPEPPYPSSEGLSPEAWDRAWRAWKSAHDAWQAGLTVGQLERARANKSAKEAPRESNHERATRLPASGDSYDWRATAEKWKLAPTIVTALEREGLAFGDSTKQAFQPYLGGPVFITSDSALNAFHVLFEDSFRELELHRAARFRSRFEALLALVGRVASEGRHPQQWQKPMNEERLRAAMDHLLRVLGPALVLSGAPLDGFDATLRPDIAATVDLIRSADQTSLPAWLGPPEDATLVAIDFSRCKPIGFYAESTRLSDYFRSVRWLQMVPFRAARNHEIDAIYLLGTANYRLRDHGNEQSLDALIGSTDDPTMHAFTGSLFSNDREPPDWSDPGTRTELVRMLIRRDLYRINSDIRLGRTLNQTFESLTFRILAPAALEDSAMFQAFIDHRLRPSGLAVAAALGSPLAQRSLANQEMALAGTMSDELDAAAARPPYAEPRLYARYLNTLRALFLPLDPAAPDFMRRPIWEAKNCQTALAGWAQMRHTFVLQGKLSASYLGMVLAPPGFVEANPEFFARLARLIDRAKEELIEAGVFSPSAAVEAEALREAARTLRKLRPAREGSYEFEGVPYPQLEPIWRSLPDEIFNENDPDLSELRDEAFARALQAILERVEAYAKRLESGTVAPRSQDTDLLQRWDRLGAIAHTLEALAHKGLRREAWTPAEDEFLKEYGQTLGYIVGYQGNSWLDPRDDAPRWAEVCSFTDRDTSLAAAVGRPREIFVLHPWNGMLVLCRGSVMQYYEYESSERLTDEQWRQVLDSEKAPALPPWLTDFAEPPTFDLTKRH